MSINYNKDRHAWHFQFERVINGQRCRASKLLPRGWSRSQADEYDRTRTAELYAIAAGIKQPKALISKAVSTWVDHRAKKLRNGKKATQDLAHLFTWIKGKTLDQLGPVSAKYAEDNPDLAPGTVRNRLAYLRAAVGWSFKHFQIGDQDYKRRIIIPAVSNERHVYLKVDAMMLLCSKCEHVETRAIVTLAFYLGKRWRSEILTLDETKIIRAGRNVFVKIWNAKKQTNQILPVHPSARWALNHIPFTYGDSFYYKDMWQAREKAGLAHVKMHDLRHSLASAMISTGSTLPEVGGALDHTSPASTKRYSHLYTEALQSAMFKVPHARKSPTGRARKAAKSRAEAA